MLANKKITCPLDFVVALELPVERSMAILLTIDDCKVFYTDYLHNNHHIVDDLMDYKAYKLSKTVFNLDKFVNECMLGDMKETFKKTFLHSFSNHDMMLVNRAIANGRVTLEYIYKEFQKNVHQNILKYVL